MLLQLQFGQLKKELCKGREAKKWRNCLLLKMCRWPELDYTDFIKHSYQFFVLSELRMHKLKKVEWRYVLHTFEKNEIFVEQHQLIKVLCCNKERLDLFANKRQKNGGNAYVPLTTAVILDALFAVIKVCDGEEKTLRSVEVTFCTFISLCVKESHYLKST